MNTFGKILPIIVVLILGGWLAGKAIPPSTSAGTMNIHEFGKLPVVYQGRVKPFDTLARNSLVIISDRQTWENENGERQPAIKWLLNVLTQTPEATSARVFRIENDQVLETMGLDPRPGFRYAIDEFVDQIAKLDEQANRARQTPGEQRDPFQVHILQLAEQVHLYMLLVESHRIPMLRGGQDVQRVIQHLQRLERNALPLAIPPGEGQDEWKPFMRAAVETMVMPDPEPEAQKLADIFGAYINEEVAKFNQSIVEYQALIRQKLSESQVEKLGFESWFNSFSPFYHCAVLYVFAFLLSCFAWLGFTRPLNRSAFWLIIITLGVHTGALIARIYLSGYPPVTNLYGSAIFIGWGCVVLGVLIEWYYKIGVGNLVAAVTGFLTLLIAHFLAGDGDTMEMMQAVLDTKFWLATHVTTVTLGYTATYFAGFLALLYILRGVLTRSLDKDTEKMFGRMIYGVVCFALLLSFVGTVLGGLWADDSWGRFWGWDPKENGALIIVLWNALILHARWGGMIKTRGIAVLAVFGNVVTSWSWFGVNQLGVGLHSYGFIDSVAFWLMMFVLSQLVIIAVGLMPREWWRSSSNFKTRDPRSTPDALPAT